MEWLDIACVWLSGAFAGAFAGRWLIRRELVPLLQKAIAECKDAIAEVRRLHGLGDDL